MALPGSGVISFNDVRTEMSQSSLSSYAMRGWTGGRNSANVGVGTLTYTPINILSSGSRWTLASRMSNTSLSTAAWYGYNHTLNIPLNVTGTLYTHMAPVSGDGQYSIYNTSMLVVDIGTTSATMSINISGSADYAEETLTVFYGKPWTNTGTGSPNTSLILQTTIGNYPSTFNYTYDSAKGQYLYFVLSYANN